MRLWLKSVRFAWQGIIFAFHYERNMRIHVVIAAIALLLTAVLDISVQETLFILLALVLVIMSELFNTAIEKTLDVAQPEPHPLARAAKDCAAAAVLICSIFAAAVGVIVFGRHLMEGLSWRW
jgi:diacylglycerol kinase